MMEADGGAKLMSKSHQQFGNGDLKSMLNSVSEAHLHSRINDKKKKKIQDASKARKKREKAEKASLSAVVDGEKRG
eukprot:CAMPEP_0206401434 /NCGR_PEP_ID=MMETSP0294-20121207/26264_1 /ASSEMBLY_ACC=CAM_ASM_000327 /TAXON_ID=39354 /ORGANISM="Heterosigma akashiwo, Strain CCMP2393" /LENGTH=75 /DNA_ID=CAMNT_0053858127 /DNA_START=36 /DNA_END=260 /DNA_ORIENTATION=-